MLRMVIARILVAVFALHVCVTLAQPAPLSTLTVVVTDQTGAVIPGANIRATNEGGGERFEGATDSNGHAVIQLTPGSYELKVAARGFKSWVEKKVEVNAEIRKTVTLELNNLAIVDPVWISEGHGIPLEHETLGQEIPLIPVQQFVPPTKPVRHRRRQL